MRQDKIKKHLGIYISRHSVAVVCLAPGEKDKRLLDYFTFTLEKEQPPDYDKLAAQIAQTCQQRQIFFDELALALDSTLYMQHTVRSRFADPRQIASTVRFDTEEALAADISDVAVAFKIDSEDQNGSNLTVFTARKKVITDILAALQKYNLDPVTIEPDINCLACFVRENVAFATDLNTLFAVLSDHNCYLIGFDNLYNVPVARCFLITARTDREQTLLKELPVTCALLAAAAKPVDCIKVFDTADSVDCGKLTQNLSVPAEPLYLTDTVVEQSVQPLESDCVTDLAIACGVASVIGAKNRSVNFRSDFNPYQGRKIKIQKAVKFLSVSVTALLLALGLHLQLQLIQNYRYQKQLRLKFEIDYLSVLPREKKLPDKTKDAMSQLKSTQRNIENQKKGLLSLTGNKAISAKLMLLFEAFNSCASQTALVIDSVSITAKSISVTGSTTNRSATLKFRNAIKEKNLGSLQESLQVKAGRDNFTITIIPQRKLGKSR